MSTMGLGAEAFGATGNASENDNANDCRGDARKIGRGPLAAVAMLAALGAAAGGGVAGYHLGKGSGSALLSNTASVTAAGYRAPAPNGRAAASGEAQDQDSRLAAMIRQQQHLRGELERARDRNKEARRELARTERAFAEASSELENASRRLAAMQAGPRRADAVAVGDNEAVVEARSEVKELRLELAAAESEKDGLAETLGTLAGTMEKVIAERDDAAAKAESLGEHVAILSEKQDRMLEQLEDAARMSLSGMQGIFERAGVDIERVLGETREDYNGAGGPFEALADEVGSSGSDPTTVRVAALMTDFEEVNIMRFAAKRMPFGYPVQGGRLTSGFGGRNDPLGRGRAMHKGIDFAGAKNTPIHTTADGVVTFSGSQRGYGRIVIVRHAFGFETRYAHLNRSHVKVGERVERGDHIADMGNTGRSTGTHLHYEVRIDREAVNPAKFIEAAHDVL